METTKKLLAESIQHLTDTIIKLSAALLVLPITLLKFVSEMGQKAHPDALGAVVPISKSLQFGLFVPFALSVAAALITHYAVIRALCKDTLLTNGKLNPCIARLTTVSALLLVLGVCFLTYLFLGFPIEVPGPFRIGISQIG